jgi:hypothetical protein
MINKLLLSGIEIQKADKEFVTENKMYGRGSWLIDLSQPKMGLIRNLLTETHYADNAWTKSENGVPFSPYDMATHTMYEFMGVTVDVLQSKVNPGFPVLKEQESIAGTVNKGNAGYWIDGRQNASFLAVNLLSDEGISVKRSDKSSGPLKPGDFFIEKGPEDKLVKIAGETGVNFNPLETLNKENSHVVKRGRIGLFQRYYGGNMDEGWTRLCFENFGFKYLTLLSEEIKKGDLRQKYDVIILPDDSKEAITGEFKENKRFRPEEYPEKYRSGIGQVGTEALKKFVKEGGTLVALGDAFEFAADAFALKIADVTKDLSSTKWFCPGSTLKVTFNNTHPLAYGMPVEG